MARLNPLQQKSILPTSKFKGPFSDLTFTSAGAMADLEAETVTQNFEQTPFFWRILPRNGYG
jgi:hypothetical protein